MKVLFCNDGNIVFFIEQWTKKNCFPHEVKFLQDFGGNYITSVENLSNPVFKRLAKGSLLKIDAQKSFETVEKCLASVCVQIDYKEKVYGAVSK